MTHRLTDPLLAAERTMRHPDRVLMTDEFYRRALYDDYGVQRFEIGPPSHGEIAPFLGTPVAIDDTIKSWAFQRRCGCRDFAPTDLYTCDKSGKCTGCRDTGFVTYHTGE